MNLSSFYVFTSINKYKTLGPDCACHQCPYLGDRGKKTSVNLRQDWSTEQVPEQARLFSRKTLPQNKNKQTKKNKKYNPKHKVTESAFKMQF